MIEYTDEQALIATLPATPAERGEDHSGDDTDMVQKGGDDGERAHSNKMSSLSQFNAHDR